MQLNEARQASVPDSKPPDERKEIIRADISKRLRSICSHCTDEQFADLVEKMTEQKLRGERKMS